VPLLHKQRDGYQSPRNKKQRRAGHTPALKPSQRAFDAEQSFLERRFALTLTSTLTATAAAATTADQDAPRNGSRRAEEQDQDVSAEERIETRRLTSDAQCC
jgi:hypothetical protein